MAADETAPSPDGPSRAALAARVEELDERLSAVEDDGSAEGDRSMAIVATQGTLDMAYPPLILATTAAAFDWDVTVFYTFWGLDVLHKERTGDLRLSAVGNPNMPVPNVVGPLPGMDRVTTRMMERRIADNDTATVSELLETALDLGVDLQACQMTMELFDYDAAELHDGVTTGVGAATAVRDMADADVQLLV